MDLLLLFIGVLILAFFFAKVEIHIEGRHGWAGNLPTWRVEDNLLLDLFWGGRSMTGYHAWMFSFILLVFHYPLLLLARFNWILEGRIAASIMLFWIAEDFLWFLLNPMFGWNKFSRKNVEWHKHWLWLFPVEYWIFGSVAALLFALTC